MYLRDPYAALALREALRDVLRPADRQREEQVEVEKETLWDRGRRKLGTLRLALGHRLQAPVSEPLSGPTREDFSIE